MKIIKKITLFTILLIFTFTIGASSVSAFKIGDIFYRTGGRTTATTFYLTTKKGGTRYNFLPIIYTATYNNQSYDIYCVDPGHHEGSYGTTFRVSEVFMEGGDTSAKYYGLSTILSTESSDDSAFITSGTSFSYAKYLAVRVFWNGHMGRIASVEVPIAITAFKNLARTGFSMSTANNYVTQGTGNNIIKDASRLYKKGIEAEQNYSANSVSNVKTEVIDVSSDVEEETTPEDVDTSFSFSQTSGLGADTVPVQSATREVTQRKIIKLTLSNFDAREGSFVFNSFSGGNSGGFNTTVVGVSTENVNDFSEFTTQISYNTNVFETFADAVQTDSNGKKSLTLYVGIESNGTVEIENIYDPNYCDSCQDVKAELKYTYKDPSVLTGAVLVRSGSYSGYQRFLVASKTAKENSGSASVTLSPCSKACDTTTTCLPVECEGDDCKYNGTLPQICSDDSEVDENGLVEYKFIEAYTQEGYNIVKCLSKDATDVQNNPYKLVDEDNAKAVSDNPYCTILCKEDYSIKLPYKQVVDEGRYFKLTLAMKGQQDCYSTKFDTDKFDEDIKAKETEIINALNEWSVLYEVVNKNPDSLYKDPSNLEYCEKVNCSVSTSNSTGCSKSTTTVHQNGWYVEKGTMIWGQNPNVSYYSIDETTGAITSVSTPPRIPEGVLKDYGYIKGQNAAEATCSITDKTTKGISSYFLTYDYIDGVALKFKKSGSTVYWELDNTGNEDPISSTSYYVRGYNSSGTLLFQRRITVRASADDIGEGTIPASSSLTKMSIAPVSNPTNTNTSGEPQITCGDNQTPCEKVEAADHLREMLPTYTTLMEQKEERVKELVEELKKIVDQYNSCAGDKAYVPFSSDSEGNTFWNMIYKYDPEIKYSYDEPDPTDSSRNKWIDEVQDLSCEDSTCDYLFSRNEEILAEDCSDDSSVNCTELGADGTFKSVFYDSLHDDEDGEDDSYVNTYCIGDVANDYTCQGTTLHTLDSSTYEDREFLTCKFTGEKFECGNETHPVTKINYVHKAAIASGDYDTRLVYYTGHHKGDIKIQYSEQPIDNYSQVPGLPVSADTPQGTYIYILNIENIGTFYSSGELGRIYSSNPKSLSSYARQLQTSTVVTYPITTGSGEDAVDLPKEININEYACTYAVSQSTCTDGEGTVHTVDECDFGGEDKDWSACRERLCPSDSNGNYCVKEAESYYVCPGTSYDKENCQKVGSRAEALSQAANNYNCCPACEVVCVGKCLYVVANDKPNDGEVQYEFRTVSPQNMNPNSRRLGYNWDTSNTSNSLAAQKASNTISEIEARAGAGSTPGINVEDISDYKLKVVMTPDMVTWIKEYNNEQATQGAYNNDSLTCYNYDLDGYSEDQCKSSGYIWQDEKCIMSNVFCYSNFIDELEGTFADQVDAPHRSEAKNSAYDNFRAYTGLANSSQSIITNDYWTIYKYDNLDINGDGIPDIGPSWK